MNELLGTGEVVDKLSIVNIKIFRLEEKLGELSSEGKHEEAGHVAIEIRENNRERQAMIRELNRRTNTGFWNDKVNHISKMER